MMKMRFVSRLNCVFVRLRFGMMKLVKFDNSCWLMKFMMLSSVRNESRV